MRFRVRLILVALVLIALAAGIRSSTGSPAETAATTPDRVAPMPVSETGGREEGNAAFSVPTIAPEQNDSVEPPPADEPRPTPRKTPTRRRRYDAVMIAAHLDPQSIEPDVLRSFWIEAADRGASDEAIEALVEIARANADRPRLAHAALDYHDDLLAVRERMRAQAELAAYGADDEDVFVPELVAGLAMPDAFDLAEEPAPAIDDYALDELAAVVRYSSEPADVTSAIQELSIERDPRVADVLLEAVDHPGADQRLAALTTLWRSAADGQADVARVRDALERARYDRQSRIADLAGTAIADLDRLEEQSWQAFDADAETEWVAARPPEEL